MTDRKRYINSEMLDKLLDFLIAHFEVNRAGRLPMEAIRELFPGFEDDILDGLFSLLHKDELISEYAFWGDSFLLALEPDAVRYATQGGYTFSEELLGRQLLLLQAQIDELQENKILDRSSKVVQTVSNITSLISTVFKIADRV